ncbi:MAG: ABC transporter substrate-binding protein [Natronomonas sp.]|uniref:ABC transporter substrate-binding protein n=1 Tax=Natronomonas sp. TaxID=2184060 RepID=UPI002870811D|nr:ABC transporter substrate-binding protein [Natronomonas sp.]MDR9380391.1 ABC transporter substrate-binding protein [Natronomonas sp.]MDR9431396.1 ABC transporter substrate-binding protein [Natronomonas sp.]
MDPAYGGLWVDYAVGSLMHQQLFEMNKEFEMVGLLAESVDISDDGLTWDIKLREGVQFHPPNQREMVAEDVVYNFDRIANPDTGSPRRSQVSPFESWSAQGDYTFRITLPQRLASIPAWNGFMGLSVLSPDALEERGDASQHPVGTGPFTFEEWTPREELRMSAFEDYWADDVPYVDEIVLRPITESSTRITEITTGNVHLDRNPPKEQLQQLRDAGKVTVDQQPSGGYRMLHLNPTEDPDGGRSPEKPTTSLEVRQAIQEAIDREAMLEIVDSGIGTTTQTWFPEESPWHVDYAPYSMAADPERAQQLIEEAGFSTPLPITILSSPDDGAIRATGRVLRDNLLQAGFEPDLQELEIGTWVSRLGNREFDIAVDWSVTQLDPGMMQRNYNQERFARPLAPVRGMHDDLFDLWEQGEATTDTAERQSIYGDLQRRLTDLSLNLPLHFRNRVEAYRNSVSGYQTHPHMLNWRDALEDANLQE